MGDYINIFVVICLACCTCLFLIAVLILCIWLNKKCYISSKTEQYKTVSERRAQEPPTAREHRKPPMVTFTTEQPSSSNPQTAQPQNHR
ncbi:unnamed protein product, partial [Mesorhabditis belari]|uniref:Uncharacterized protein n=1 Tax=Mesorhabditis belari TaxID=2138241 RepID=A0AAF3J653_9BILA